MKICLFLWVLSTPIWAQEFFKGNLGESNAEGNALFEDQKYEEALNTYLDLYGQDTDNGALAYNIGNTYLALGDSQKARQFFDRALGSNHELAKKNASFNLSCLQMHENDVQGAIANLVEYLKIEPEDLQAKRNLEVALRRLEQEQQTQQQQSPEDQQQQSQQGSPEGDSGSSDSQNSQDQQENSEGQSQNDENQSSQNQNPPDGQPPQDDEPLDEAPSEAMKQQILNALQEKEAKQQQQYQKRKIGRVKRHAKDW